MGRASEANTGAGGKARRNVQDFDDEVDQSWTAAYGWTAKKMLKHLEDTEAFKVSTRDLKEQFFSPDESNDISIVRVARQARSEKSKKLFQIFRQGTNVLIASMARWEEHSRGLVVLERHCLALREEVVHLSEKQEVLATLMEGKMSLQKVAPEKFQERVFQEFKKSWRTKEAVELLGRKHKLGKLENWKMKGIEQ